MNRRIAIAVVALAAVAALFFVLRPEDDDDAAATRTLTNATTPPELEPTVTIDVRLEWRIDGRDDAIDRKSVTKGTPLMLTVVADVADEVHVHGYDVTADVAPGKPAQLELDTTITGRFEIELEGSHRQVAQLTVSP